ncbi:hypothetical protein BN1708_014435, partial [Verticillium longisporum]
QPSIVFIHGFTGHPERTWLQQSPYTHQKQASSGTKNVRSSRFQGILDSLKGRPKNNVCWPRDLLPTILPDARVLTYGYDTRISHPFGPQRSQSGVYAIARDFLFELEGRRQPPGRPIIFVVHSLGGIVVKQLLKASSQSLDERAFLKDIYDSTAGVLFFGTPHAGADPRGLAHHVVQSIARAMRISANSQVLDTLLPSSERLEELRDHFKPMAIRQNWLIYSFQEALPVQLLGKKVVEDVSSCLDIPQEIRQHIHANHMEMCRFNELEDSQFQKVKHALRRLAEAALARTRATSPGPSMESDAADLTEEQKKVLIQSLAFEQLDARQGSIKKAHDKTCRWLLQRKAYLDWLDSDKFDRHYGFLWIQGKPGVGKSTIMKFLCTEMKNSSESVKIIITFFFNASGDDLERSTLGMYRSLLLQLLDEIPPLWAIFNHVYRLRWRTAERHCWDVGILQELLEAAVEHLENHSVTFFIDALDECKDSDVHDMIDFMRRMSQKSILFGSQVRTCFSSRHYPIITLERGIEVVLENQSGHAEDIKEYIEAKLKLGPSQAAKDFGSEVQQKAAGVFMWVVLVVHILNDAHVGGQGRIQELRKRLDVLPRDLHDLFRNILDRNNTNLEHLALCLQWILFARRPLTPLELYFAIHCDGNTLGGLQSAAWDREDIPLDMIERFIITSSKGLAEIRRSRRPTVQFIHESVREFFLESHGMINIDSSVQDEVEGRSQERLEKCCANYIDHVFNSIEMTNFLAKDLPVAHTTTESRLLGETCERIFPFLRYAVQYVFLHAEKAQQAGLQQNKFLEDFQFQHWLGLFNIILGRQTRRYKQSGLDCLLVEGNLPALLELFWGQTHAPRHACFVNSGAHYQYGSPLMVAVARDNRDVLRKVLDMQASYCGFEDLIPDLRRECDNAPSPLVREVREFDFQPHIRKAAGNALLATSDLLAASSTLLQIFAAVSWHYQDFSSKVDDLIRRLLSDRNFLALKVLSRSPKLRSKRGNVFRAGTPHLVEACILNHKEKVAMLLEIDVQLAVGKDDSGICTLTHACRAGYPEIIALVLEASKSARHDSIHGRVDAPDHAEEHQECEELAELLVKNSDHDFSTSNMSALAYYATKGSDVMVEALLRSGAEADAVPWRGLSPLTCGIEGGHSGVVRLLVNAGASAIASSRFDQAPLALTASLGHDMISADLLSAGAEVNHKSIDGRTALSYAAENGHHAIAIQLSQRGADLNHESAYGRNALSYAAENGHETIVDLLLVEHVHDPISGADATAQHSNCPQLVPSRQCASTELRKLLTPLHYASAACHSGIVERLLKRGADVESRNAWSQTPLVFTAAAGHANFDVLCLAIGSTQMSSPQDTTPFPPADSIGFAHASAPEMDSGTVPGGDAVTLETEAIRSGRLHTVELLLLHGALIDSADYDGHTAVAWAAARGDTEMLNFSSREARRLMFGHAKAVAFLLHTGEAAADSKTLVLVAGREEAEDRD